MGADERRRRGAIRRILIVASWYPTERDPVGGIFVEDQARALSARYEVAVIAPDMRRLVHARRDGLAPRLVVEHRNGLLVLRPGVVAIATWRQAGWSYRRAVGQAYRELVRRWGRPDVIHAHVVFPGGWSAAHLARRQRLPVVLTEHSSPFSARISTPWLRRTVRWTLENVDRRVAVSPGLREQIRSFAPLDVDVVANVCDTVLFSPADVRSESAAPAAPFRFLTLGILTPQKGVDVLLDAARRLLDGGRDGWELVVAGDGPDRSSLERQATSLGLGERCRFVGRVTREQASEWMRWADVFVLASRHETFGLVVAEALACDTPVIATRSGGPEHILTDDVGLLVDPEDPVSLADAMATALEGGLRPAPGIARSSATSRFGPEVFARSMEALYASLP